MKWLGDLIHQLAFKSLQFSSFKWLLKGTKFDSYGAEMAIFLKKAQKSPRPPFVTRMNKTSFLSIPGVESLASRTSSRTHVEVLGLSRKGQVFGLGLKAPSPRGQGPTRGHILKSLALAAKVKSLAFAWKLQVLENCPVLGSRTALFFVFLKSSWKAPETLRKI